MAKKTIAELKAENTAWFTDNNNNEIEGLQHNEMNEDIIDSFAHESTIKSLWRDNVVDIRKIKTPYKDLSAGNYSDNSLYKFDPTNSSADDGVTILKPDDLTVGRWVRQTQFADRDKIENQAQTSIVGVDDVSGFYKSPYAGTGNPAYKIIDKNNNTVGYFTDDGQLFVDKIKPKSSYLFAGAGEKTYWVGNNMYQRAPLYIERNGSTFAGEIRFNNSPGYTFSKIRQSRYDAGHVGVEIVGSLAYNDESSMSISFAGNFAVNNSKSERKFLASFKNIEYPTSTVGKLTCVNGSVDVTILNSSYSSFEYDFQIGGNIKIGANTYVIASYIAGSTNTITLTTPFLEADSDYLFYLTDKENKLTLTRFGFMRIANNAGVAEERLDVADTTKMEGVRYGLRTITADYLPTKQDRTIRTDSSLNTIDVTLPEITAKWHGQEFVIKTKDITNATTINTQGTDTFDDGTVIHTFSSVNEIKVYQADFSSKQWIEL